MKKIPLPVQPALNLTHLLPVLFLSLPFYFIAKYIEKKIRPRESGWRLLGWFFAVIGSACVYFYVLVGAYVHFLHPRLFIK